MNSIFLFWNGQLKVFVNVSENVKMLLYLAQLLADNIKHKISILANSNMFSYHLTIAILSKNFALGKLARQSSTKYDGIASKGVDDNVNGDFYGLSCTHTNFDDSPAWWEVDLGSVYTVRFCLQENADLAFITDLDETSFV